MYWLSSNMFSLGQVACLRIPAVRTVLKIPQRVVHDPDKLPPREGFIKSFRQGKGPPSVTRTGDCGLEMGAGPMVFLPFTQVGRMLKWPISYRSGNDACRTTWSSLPGVNNPSRLNSVICFFLFFVYQDLSSLLPQARYDRRLPTTLCCRTERMTLPTPPAAAAAKQSQSSPGVTRLADLCRLLTLAGAVSSETQPLNVVSCWVFAPDLETVGHVDVHFKIGFHYT